MNEETSLKLYLSYDYLPVRQQANILSAVDNLHAALSEIQIRKYYDYPELFYYRRVLRIRSLYGEPYLYPPLCIGSAKTGNSIEFKFTTDQKVLPDFRFHEEDLHILFPKWYAAVAVTGMILTGGMSLVNQAQETQKNQLEIENLKNELKAMKEAKEPLASKVEIHLHQFNQQINYQNIINVSVNDISIKSSNKTEPNK